MTTKPDNQDERIREVARGLLLFEDAVCALDVFRAADCEPAEAYRAMANDPTLRPVGYRGGLRTFALKES